METCWDEAGKAATSIDIDITGPQNRAMIDYGNSKVAGSLTSHGRRERRIENKQRVNLSAIIPCSRGVIAVESSTPHGGVPHRLIVPDSFLNGNSVVDRLSFESLGRRFGAESAVFR